MTDGIYNDITIEAYHENKTHLSATQIKLAKKSLKLLDWTRRGLIPKEDKPHFSFGNAFELALLDRKGFEEKVAIIQDSKWVTEALEEKPDLQKPRSSKHYQNSFDKFMEENKGKYMIPDKGKDSFETIEKMLESCYADKVIQALIKNTEYQLTIFWTDPQTGLKLKTRPDIMKRNKNIIINVKTTEDGSPQGFARDLVKYDYPLQAVHEMNGCKEMGIMDKVDNYYWLVCEKNAPHNATIYDFDEEDMKVCEVESHMLYDKIKRAEDENLYPGYSDRADNKYGILRAPIPMFYKAF